MAVLTSSNYSSNAIVGTPQVGAAIDLFKTSSNAEFAVGFGFTRADGARFRYVQYGATCSAGDVVAQDISEMSILASIGTNTGLDSATTTAVAGDPVKPGDKGSHYLEVSLTPTNAALYAGGYLVVCGGSGSGTCLRIKQNTASGTPSTGRSRLEFYDPLPFTLTSTSDLAIIGNIYANVEGATATDALAVGASVAGGAANTFGWVQSKGIAAVNYDAATSGVIGNPIMVSTTTAGCVTDLVGTAYTAGGSTTTLNLAPIGTLVVPSSGSTASIVYLSIE